MLAALILSALAVIAVLALGIGALAALAGAIIAAVIPRDQQLAFEPQPLGLVLAGAGVIFFVLALSFLLELAPLA